jgi:glutamate formiminotransferase
VASHCIDLRKHQGVHPRMGATDVVPFVSLGPARHRCHTACRRFWSGRA